MGSPSRKDEYAEFRAALDAFGYLRARRLASYFVEGELIDRLRLLVHGGQQENPVGVQLW